MRRVALTRSNPAPRLATISAAASRRQVANLPAIVEAEVGAVAGDLAGLAASTTAALTSLEERVYDLENPIP